MSDLSAGAVRGSGRTSRQIKGAPRGSLFVCHDHGAVGCVRSLALKLGRSDLKIVTLSDFDHYGRFAGIKDLSVVVDHWAAECMSSRQAENLRRLMPWRGRE